MAITVETVKLVGTTSILKSFRHSSIDTRELLVFSIKNILLLTIQYSQVVPNCVHKKRAD